LIRSLAIACLEQIAGVSAWEYTHPREAIAIAADGCR